MTSQLVKWYSENKTDEFEVIMVTGDRTEKKMFEYMKGKKIPFPALKLKDVDIGKKLGFNAYPWIIMVDEKGTQVVSEVASGDFDKITKKLK